MKLKNEMERRKSSDWLLKLAKCVS